MFDKIIGSLLFLHKFTRSYHDTIVKHNSGYKSYIELNAFLKKHAKFINTFFISRRISIK